MIGLGIGLAIMLVVVVCVAIASALCWLAYNFIYYIYYIVLRASWRAPYQIWKSPHLRKNVYYMLTLNALYTIPFGCILLWWNILEYPGPIHWLSQGGIPSIFFMVPVFAVCLLGLVVAYYNFVFSFVFLYVVTDDLDSHDIQDVMENGMYINGEGWIWYKLGSNDQLTPLRSVMYRLGFRTLNVLSPLIWLGIVIYLLPRYLTTFRTALTAGVATALSTVHLGIAYHYDWIAWINPNFYLALAITLSVGWFLGSKIPYMKDVRSIEFPPWPTMLKHGRQADPLRHPTAW